MNTNSDSSFASNIQRKYLAVLMGWSLLVAGSLIWNIRQEAQVTMGMAIATARTNISKDISFRKWVASHGGVYVSPSERTPPNPYLKVPDRDVTTTTGKPLTLMNPAYALRELQNSFVDASGIRSHITSLKLLNPGNVADDWETGVLKKFEQGSKEVMEVSKISGQSHLRLMTPFIVESDCLKCHKQQGYKLGDIRGGISADVPLSIYQADERNRNTMQILSHGLIWLIGFIGLGAAYRRERLFDNERKQMEDKVRQLAFHDTLTKLPNRRLLIDRLLQSMAASKRSGCFNALFFIDLDNFKPLNDTYGHDVGDLLLIEVARRISSCVREVDTVSRFGGDEFVVMLSELESDKAESTIQAGIVAEKIRATLAKPYLLTIRQEGKAERTVEHHCTSSIGVVLFTNHEASLEDILRWADIAMYQAKEDGRNLIRFFDKQARRDAGEADQGSRMLHLNWHESYNCGESTIDQQHRKLFDLANILIESAFTRDENPQRFDSNLEKLLAHVVQHFADEEAILARYHYADLDAHARAHRELTERALRLRDAASAGGVTVGDLVNFLANEVIAQHMLKTDREFYPLFK